jgi:uncharacterized repeat protein (TIGR03803 family)
VLNKRPSTVNPFSGKTSRQALVMCILFVATLAGTHAFAQTETILLNLQPNAVGYSVAEGVVFDSSGNLYGVTGYGGGDGSGTVFEMSPAGGGTWSAPVIILDVAGRGESPLIFHDGSIFTTGIFVGRYGGGVYELSPGAGGWTQDVVYDFQRRDVNGPWGNVAFDSSGNLYGTSQAGPKPPNLGAVFELTPTESGEWTESLPFVGSGSAYGVEPIWAIVAPSGNLYVATLYGGEHQGGVVFQLAPAADGWTPSVMYAFPTGSEPCCLILDASGDVYGTTFNGGTYGGGTLFKLKKTASGAWGLQTLHNFGGGSDGASPAFSAPVFDSAGNIYGTTYGGGTAGLGVVYKLSAGSGGSWTETILHNFANDGVDGNTPQGGVVFGSDGNLYGTTYYGGLYGDGTVYELTLD